MTGSVASEAAIAVRRVVFDNGLEVVLAEDPSTPLVHVQCELATGVRHEPSSNEGLMSLTLASSREGAGSRTGEEIGAALQDRGADLIARTGWDSVSLSIEMLAEDLAFGIELLYELLVLPLFPHQALERLRGRFLARLGRQAADAGQLAGLWLARAIYGDGAYGRAMLGTVQSLRSLDRQAVVHFHRAHFRGPGTMLAAVGGFDADALVETLRARYAEFPGPATPGTTPTAESLQAPDEPLHRAVLIDCPDLRQVQLRVGLAAVPQDHPDAPALRLLAQILGERALRELRGKRGAAYSVRCGFDLRQGPGPFAIATGVEEQFTGEAIQSLLGEFEQLRRRPADLSDVEEARNTLVGKALMARETLHGSAARLRHGGRDDSGDFDLGPERLREAAVRHLSPQRLAIVAAGRVDGIRSHFAGLGPVREVLKGETPT